MRKCLISAFLLLASVWLAPAQNENLYLWNWDIEAGLSIPFIDRSVAVGLDGKSVLLSDISLVRSSSNSATILPTFYVSAGRHIDNTPLCVRLGLYMNHAFNQMNGGPSPLRERETILHLMPELRVYYLRRPYVRLYATLGAGLRTRFYSETLDGDTVGKAHFGFTWQITPLGIEVGKNWYVNVSGGYGLPCPVAVSVGYKFQK